MVVDSLIEPVSDGVLVLELVGVTVDVGDCVGEAVTEPVGVGVLVPVGLFDAVPV